MFRGERVAGRRLLAGVAMLNNRVAGTFSRNEDVYQDPATGNWFTNRPRERQLLHPSLSSLPPLIPTPSPFAHPLTLQTFPHPCPSSASFPLLLAIFHLLLAETNQLEFSMHRRRIFPISWLSHGDEIRTKSFLLIIYIWFHYQREYFETQYVLQSDIILKSNYIFIF